MTSIHTDNTHHPANATDNLNTIPRYDSAEFRRTLLVSGDVTEADLQLIDQFQKQQGATELRALLDLGLVSEESLADRLAAHLALPRWDAAAAEADNDAELLTSAVPLGFMRASAVLAIAGDSDPVGPTGETADRRALSGAAGDRLIIADPSDHAAIASVLTPALHDPPRVLVGTAKRIEAFLENHVQHPERRPAADTDDARADISADLAQLRDMASEAPVIRFFNQAVERAMELAASDIHLERFERDTHLRLRVDGMLQEHPPPAPNMYDALLTRIKIMAGLDIAERRRAQDGRIRLRLRGRNVDMRVSIVPTMYGQDAAIRIQDRQRLASVKLADLGFTNTQINNLFACAAKSHGILLITGPTGSGKTTTLYAILRQLVSAERKVMTVEDPVEYAMPGVNQIQVNPAINLSFSNTLRHILRHDPDVILVGEIRDAETAQMAFQASLTGHMVLSTLHTNDVPSSFIRLVDMGVEPYLVNAAVEGVSAQRLLRKLDEKATARAGAPVYKGRVAVMEFTTVTPAIKNALLQTGEEQALRRVLLDHGFEPMRHAAERLITLGVTDRAEVERVLGAPATIADDINFDAVSGAGP